MAYRPKTVAGNIVAALLVVAAVPIVLWAAVTLSGPAVWISLVIVTLASIAVYLWRRRVNAARERAWVGAFTFADVVERMHTREALHIPIRERHHAPLTA
jgi:hypothetical protein